MYSSARWGGGAALFHSFSAMIWSSSDSGALSGPISDFLITRCSVHIFQLLHRRKPANPKPRGESLTRDGERCSGEKTDPGALCRAEFCIYNLLSWNLNAAVGALNGNTTTSVFWRLFDAFHIPS